MFHDLSAVAAGCSPRRATALALVGLVALGGIAQAQAQAPADPLPVEVVAQAPADQPPPGPAAQPEPFPAEVPSEAGGPPATTPAPIAVAAPPPPSDAKAPFDQGIGAAIGLATGGRVTAGGLRITGHYLYQLSSRDWFDGTAAFTFGSGAAGCFRDREDDVRCDHGLADGGAVELTIAVRRMFAAQGGFRPFARVGLGASIVRFSDDEVTGFVVPLHAGGGLRARAGDGVAIVATADLALGLGGFTRGLGLEPQLGFAVTAGAELRLR